MTCHRCHSAPRGTRTRYGKKITDSYCVPCRKLINAQAQARWRERDRRDEQRSRGAA